MAVIFKPRRTTGTTPTTSNMADGELAVNTTSRSLYVRVGAAIVDMFANLATLASPALTGTPTAPTATAGTNTTQIATTAFVTTAVAAGGGGGTVGFEIDGGSASTTYSGLPAFDFGSST